MAANYVLLEKVTVGAAGVASVTFNNIPQTGYTDLVLKTSNRTTNAGTWANITSIALNGVTTNQTSRNLLNIDGSASSNSFSPFPYWAQGNGATSNTFGNSEFYIPNYTSSNYKSISVDHITENNGASMLQQLTAYLWSSTSAITSITFNGNFLANSTFYLYGVAALNTTPTVAPKASGGNTIMTDGTYWYHAFLSSGTFTPAVGLTCDYLVVAGGGGGAGQYYYTQGGGGAGGLRSTVTATGGGGSLESKLSLASGTSYTVTIGAGGAGATGPLGGDASTHRGTQGSNSVFSTITSTGGGGGAASDSAATSGGSGGGAGDVNGGAASPAGQGYAGGASGGGGGWSTGGGGGGAGAVGGNGTNPTPGAGGIGVQITALATPTNTGANRGFYAGGGGGGSYDSLSVGAGGLGGGGTGSSTSTGVSGTANTGGGGGAGSKYFSTYYSGGSGGSGIVIVRYLVA